MIDLRRLTRASLPERVYRVGRSRVEGGRFDRGPDAWIRKMPVDRPIGSLCRYDDPEYTYRVIYAASSPYGAYMAALADFHPSRETAEALGAIRCDRDDQLPETPAAGYIGAWLGKRFIASGILGARSFADLTKFPREEVTENRRAFTMQLSRAIFELQEPRFDGICYSSRYPDVVRFAIFDRDNEDDGDWITDRRSDQIDLNDPYLKRALEECHLRTA